MNNSIVKTRFDINGIRSGLIDMRKQIALKARALSLNKKYNKLKFSNLVLCVTTDQPTRGFFFEQMLLQGKMLKMFQNYSQYKSLKSLIKKYKNFYNANDHINMRDTGNNILMEIYDLPQDFQSKLFNIYLDVIYLFAESNTKVVQWKQMLKKTYNYNFIVYSLSPISQQLFSGIVPKKVRYTKKSICPVIMATVLEKMIKELKTATINVTLTPSTVNQSTNKNTKIHQSNVSITLGGIQLQSRRQGVDNSTIEYMVGESKWVPIKTYKSMGGPFKLVKVQNKTMQYGQYNTETVIIFKNMKFKFVLSTAAPAAINNGANAMYYRSENPTGSEHITVSIGETPYMTSIANFTASEEYETRHVTENIKFKILNPKLLNDSDMCEGAALVIIFGFWNVYF